MAELTVQQMLDLREHRQQLATGEAEDMPNDEKQCFSRLTSSTMHS